MRQWPIAGGVAAALMMLLAPTAGRAEVVDRVLAIAAGQAVLASDVEIALAFGLVHVEPQADRAREALERLVDRRLVLGEVDRYVPPEPGVDAVDRAIDGVRSRFPNAAAFEAALVRTGVEERHLRGWLRQDLRIAAYLEQRFMVEPPAEEEIATAFEERRRGGGGAGALATLDEDWSAVERAIVGERRAAQVAEWVAGLRRRTPVVYLQ